MKIPTVIFRLKTDGDGIIVPGTEYLARDPGALLEQVEWSWVEDIDEAFHFEDLADADRFLERLKAQGVAHVHAMPFGGDLRAAREARRREAGRAPERVYAETMRRLGERD